ncbi:MAG: PIN domain-containing protein [Lachnospiraceae bacterium]|nr:PIN domain-containing protein [Lachnospiraceae bacterium]MBQ2405127.1 PIN domain-containing protein [Lachnospiraceae bacterium]MBQ5850300.1 PIN domain-containing protein [Lachnospiraceae bacterium]MEE0920490.1 PIN domain-containing protein [Lachnospiraceae bacterium]
MVLLIDANIILDVLMNRQEFVKDSSMIWKLCETEQLKGYISTLSFANIMYIMRKELDPDKIEEVFRKLNLIFEFADFSKPVLEKAVEMNWKDFEDAVQSATAEQIHADYIITRNVRDFAKSKVIAFTPSELLSRI